MFVILSVCIIMCYRLPAFYVKMMSVALVMNCKGCEKSVFHNLTCKFQCLYVNKPINHQTRKDWITENKSDPFRTVMRQATAWMTKEL